VANLWGGVIWKGAAPYSGEKVEPRKSIICGWEPLMSFLRGGAQLSGGEKKSEWKRKERDKR